MQNEEPAFQSEHRCAQNDAQVCHDIMETILRGKGLFCFVKASELGES